MINFLNQYQNALTGFNMDRRRGMFGQVASQAAQIQGNQQPQMSNRQGGLLGNMVGQVASQVGQIQGSQPQQNPGGMFGELIRRIQAIQNG